MAQREWVEKDFYKELGVSSDASADEIKRAYRKLARDLHPDTNSDPSAAERFKAVSEAHSVLSDPAKRKEYDETRRLFAGGGFGRGRFSGGNFDGFGSDGNEVQPERLVRRGRADRWGEHRRPVRRIVRPWRAAAPEPAAPRQRPGDRNRAVVHGGHQGRGDAIAAHQPGAVHELPWQRARPGTSPKVCPNCNGSGVVSRNQGAFGFSDHAPNAGAAARSLSTRARSATAPE